MLKLAYIEETWNKTDPSHGCQRLGNGQGKISSRSGNFTSSQEKVKC